MRRSSMDIGAEKYASRSFFHTVVRIFILALDA